MKRNLLGLVFAIGMLAITACGSSSSSGSGTTVSPADVSTSVADETTGVAVASFSDTVTWPSGNAVDADTVTSTSFYIVPVSASAQVTNGAWNADNCNVDNALENIEIDTSVDNGTSSSTITVLEDLDYDTTYFICLTTAITFANGATFEGITNFITTVAEGAFTLTSTDITNGGAIPDDNAWNADGCSGSNLSPQLSWSNPPDGTLGYAILMIDTDATDFIHWILYNIPTSVTSLDEGASTPSGATTVTNDWSTSGYGGPCPPATHTYAFRVYALDVADASTISGFDASSNNAFTGSISDNVLDYTTITGTYDAP